MQPFFSCESECVLSVLIDAQLIMQQERRTIVCGRRLLMVIFLLPLPIGEMICLMYYSPYISTVHVIIYSSWYNAVYKSKCSL